MKSSKRLYKVLQQLANSYYSRTTVMPYLPRSSLALPTSTVFGMRSVAVPLGCSKRRGTRLGWKRRLEAFREAPVALKCHCKKETFCLLEHTFATWHTLFLITRRSWPSSQAQGREWWTRMPKEKSWSVSDCCGKELFILTLFQSTHIESLSLCCFP
jgi:hypothetical protein